MSAAFFACSMPRNVPLVHILDKGARRNMAPMARDDTLAELRRAKLTELLAGRFDGNKTAMAQALGRSNSQIGHWFSGIRNPNGDTCRLIESALELPRGWLDGDAEDDPAETPLAHAVSHRQPIVTPKTKAWGDLVRDEIDGQFLLAVKGEALMPVHPPGQLAIWQACDHKEVNPGQAVLVWLPGDHFELRFFERRGGTWAGVSQRVGFGELLPDRDGAHVVARLRYPDLG